MVTCNFSESMTNEDGFARDDLKGDVENHGTLTRKQIPTIHENNNTGRSGNCQKGNGGCYATGWYFFGTVF